MLRPEWLCEARFTTIIGVMRHFLRFKSRQLLIVFCAGLLSAGILSSRLAQGDPSEPWSDAQALKPAQLAAELEKENDPHVIVIYVGARTLYNGGHIPGAMFYGQGSTEQGIAELKKSAASLPKSSNVVLYCGCCPLEKCPNLRPAVAALREFGFAKLRVLILPTSFNVDWVERGFPVASGS